MKVRNEVISSKTADFIINDYTFEVGGKNKQQKQIAKDGNSYIVKDDIEFWVYEYNSGCGLLV